MKKCNQCSRELPENWSTDICLECSEENVRKIFNEYPEVKECFKKTIEGLKQELEEERFLRLWNKQ